MESTLTGLSAQSIVCEGDIIIAMTFEEEIEDGAIICAFFDDSERMVKVVSVPVIRPTDTIYVTAEDKEEISMAKIMTRDSLTSMEPATLAATVEIAR